VLKVKNGDFVEAGTVLTEGSIYPNDFLRTRGVNEVQNYLLNEVLATYSSQGVELNTKHVEIIIRQMLKNVKVEDSGDTSMLVGDIVDHFTFEEENDKVVSEGGVPATAKRLVQGITKSSLSNPSFLAAASFQETSRVLTDASVKGKVDKLISLKENLMIGKQIPAGTGFHTIRDLGVVDTREEDKELAVMDDQTKELFEEEVEEFI
jgi:DNA-directed RNA polymerase subunit beta'